MELKYTYPAEKWNQALPIGNGSIGGLVYGQPFHEMIELNEDSLWSGGYTDRNNADCKKYLEEIRKLLHAGKTAEAEDLSRLAMHGIPVSQRCYQTLGK
jgi:alpha-L-fucosidase 2